jgi:hypothetical protein
VAAGLEATQGSYQSRKWRRQSGSNGERRRRRQAAAGGSGGGVARSGEASRKERRRWAGSGATRGGQGWQVGASGGTARRPAARQSCGRREAEDEEEEGVRQGLICCFQKFQGPHCKPTFPTNLKFK